MPSANEAISIPDFFLRNGLTDADVELCLSSVRERYADREVVPVKGQGGCSFTVIVRARREKGEGGVVVQFRRVQHAMRRSIAFDARSMFGELVPEPMWVDEVVIGEGKGVRLQVCGMTRVQGVMFGDLQPRGRRLAQDDFERVRGLMADIAGFFAMSWEAAGRKKSSPAEANGKVGSSIRERLVKLEDGLPTKWLRSRARTATIAFDSGYLDYLPLTLNHGDLLPSNIMVDRQSWRLSGLVDWAEAEYLPFGMTLYGIEHLLGFFDKGRGRFVYYDQANEIRDVFWQRLKIEVPALTDRRTWEAMMCFRDIGILLWHGIAWDDGRLNRVVDAENDGEELEYLQRFLGGSRGSRDSKL